MRHRGLVTFILVAIIAISAGSASALDGTRKGFILSFGIGPGVTSWEQEISGTFFGIDVSAKSDKESSFGVTTDFKIGGGITEQFLLYYENRVAWFSVDYVYTDADGDILATETITFAHAIGGVGVSYYLKTEAPSLYFLGSIGLSTWSAPFESTWGDTWAGVGLSAGVGYEFAKHWSAEGTFNFGKPGTELFPGIDYTVNAVSFLFTVGGTLY